MNDVLRQIVERTREDLRHDVVDWRALHRAARNRAAQKTKHSFQSALRRGTGPITVIAEVKGSSPSAGTIVENPDVVAIASQYRDGGASAISVVTEPHFFHGSMEWVYRARSVGLPVVMKDFVVDPVQIYRGVAAGADAVLLLSSVLDVSRLREFLSILSELGRDGLVEVHDEQELEQALEAGAQIVGVNNRDLRTFAVDLATSERLRKSIPDSVVTVAESGVRTRDDALRLENAGFDAILVGESLLRQADRRVAVEMLRGIGS
ncbi:MAG: indole-3-glycerol phosphate synthase TrpC [Acidobacteriota bacterium]